MLSLNEILNDLGQAETRKLRSPRPKPGELKLCWGKVQYMDPDLVVAGGSGTARADRSLLMSAVTQPNPPGPLKEDWEPSLAEELHRRGYDLRTLRISIRKTKGAPDATKP